MTKKMMSKVCIDCVNANEHLKFGPEFKVSVEFGTCDCCGKRHVLVPFGRFFDDKIELTPCTAEAIPQEDGTVKDNIKHSSAGDISDLHERCNKLEGLLKEISEDLVCEKQKTKWQEEIEKRLIELEPNPVGVESPSKTIQPYVKDKKKDDKKNDKMFD